MLQLRMGMLLAAMFGIVYAIAVMAGTAMGMQSFYLYLILALAMMAGQYFMGPKMVEWSMKIRYVTAEEHPKLHAMIAEQAERAGIPKPKVCISAQSIPNAFAFGRGHRDGRVCVTEGIMRLLTDEELKAVIGHEITHIKNRDVLTITLLSVVPIIMYRIAWHFLLFGGRGRNRDNGGSTLLIGLGAFVFYFITNLLVLYGSRIREYFADKGAVELGNRPEALATALYKLVYGSARMGKAEKKEVEGLKAFFLNDPSVAADEIRELSQLDLDRNGVIDASELAVLRSAPIALGSSDRAMELMATHPNMLKRIRHLAELA